MFGEDLQCAVRELDRLIDNYPVRGLKGPVGTQMDLLTLFEGDAGKVEAMESAILDHLGVGSVLETVGQVYPRSLDFEWFLSSSASSSLDPLVLLRPCALWQGMNWQVKALQRTSEALRQCPIR